MFSDGTHGESVQSRSCSKEVEEEKSLGIALQSRQILIKLESHKELSKTDISLDSFKIKNETKNENYPVQGLDESTETIDVIKREYDVIKRESETCTNLVTNDNGSIVCSINTDKSNVFKTEFKPETGSNSFCTNPVISINHLYTNDIKIKDRSFSYCKKENKNNLVNDLIVTKDMSQMVFQTFIAEIENSGPYVCLLCDNFTTSFENKLLLHIRSHSMKNFNYTCYYCNFSCNERNCIKRHVKLHLNGQFKIKNFYRYLCLICNDIFDCGQKIKLHVMRAHTGEKPYLCKLCEFSSAAIGEVKIHVRIHTLEKPYICHFCGYRCAQSSRMTTHVKSHKGIKPHACPFCDYKCTRRTTLTVHIRTHTGEKPFSCQYCEYRCIHPCGIKRHLKKHSDKNSSFACHYCEHTFKYKTALTHHIKKFHITN